LSALAEKISAEIALQRAISFERFMALALYCPTLGYYDKKEDRLGARGDFYTSVSVGGLFGELLGWQFAEWLKTGQEQVQIVEAGTHRGELARDVLRWLRERRPALFERLRYLIVEPSERRQSWQKETLEEFDGQVGWVRTLAEVGRPAGPAGQAGQAAGVRGVIFSNELLDAMPVRRWGWEARTRRWFEWGVTLKGGQFEWTRLESPVQNPTSEPGAGFGVPAALEEVLPDGFTVETNEAAAGWWREAAGVLAQGRLLTLDYGLTEEELFVPERPEGTLRAYRRHQVSRNVLTDPGEQDLTAHVNFTHIQQAGEAMGLQTEVLTTQERFLTGIAAQIWQEPARFGEWTQGMTRQFQTLTHPEHLGRAFRVLVQARLGG
jgi:SAM-dependent MidA family methyltransferase